jgi:hypothetical protein
MIEKTRIKQRVKLFRPVLIPMILYIGLLVFAVSKGPQLTGSIWGYVLALLPMVPGVFIALGVFRAVAQLDELERRIIFEAVAFSFTLTFLLLLSLSLINLVAGPQLRVVYIPLIMAILLGVGKLWGNWRYR